MSVKSLEEMIQEQAALAAQQELWTVLQQVRTAVDRISLRFSMTTMARDTVVRGILDQAVEYILTPGRYNGVSDLDLVQDKRGILHTVDLPEWLFETVWLGFATEAFFGSRIARA